MIYLIGNATRDKIVTCDAAVETIGGTVWYAAQLLVRLKQSVAVIGSGDIEVKRRLEKIRVDVRHFSIDGAVTHFENDYTGEKRRQRAKSGDKLLLSAMPPALFEGRAMLVGPVLQEIDPAILSAPRKGLALLDAQGFLRYLTDPNRVIERMTSDAETAIRCCDILKVDSRESQVITAAGDIDTALERLYRMGPKITIVTQGAKGARIFDGARLIQIAAPKVTVVDSTGAGDVFAAAFLTRYLVCREPISAGQFAVAAASLSTLGFGASALPSRMEIEQLMERHFSLPHTIVVHTKQAFQ